MSSVESLSRARVSFAAQERYRLLFDDFAECEAVATGALRWNADLPAVGDWVSARRVDPDLAIIEEVLPRRTVISRKHPGRNSGEQVIAANVDTILLVMALDRDFNLRRLERYLVLSVASGARPVVVLNKVDLCPDFAARIAEVESVAPDVTSIPLSALDSVGPLRVHIDGRTVVLLGSSGAGKSTIVNGLLGESHQSTQSVRESDSRGRHTTTSRMLFPLPGGGALIDTPGLRELALWAGEDSLDEAFSDIAAVAVGCRFNDCSHEAEPGCAIVEALASGAIPPDRWSSYLKLRAEVRYLEDPATWRRTPPK